MTKYICDGHEYNVTKDGDEYLLSNNYGKHVATLEREPAGGEEWWVLLPNGELIARWHENTYPDNTLESEGVQAYVAWAIDNETVEGHS